MSGNPDNSEPIPNWTNINTLFNKIDELLEEAFTKKEMNFMEIEVAFMLAKEKLLEEKMRAYHHYFNEEHIDYSGQGSPNSDQKPPKDFYR